MAVNGIGGISDPQNTNNTSSAGKTDGVEEKQNTTITYTANGVTNTIETNEDDLQEINIEEESSEEKIFNDKMSNCERQLETLFQQLTTLQRRMQEASKNLAAGGDIASTQSQINSISQNINSVYDSINGVYLTMMSYEGELEASTMDFLNSGAVSADASNFTFREGATEEGKHVIETALKYDDKAAGEMSTIMTDAGYQYHGGAWCADFVTFALGQAYGGKDKIPGNFASTCANTAYCPEIVNWATGNGSWTTDPNTLQPGDMVLFDWDGDGTSDHVGLFVSVNADGTINTVEGNTSGAGGGSCVEAKVRAPETVLGYSRLSGLK